MFITRLLLVVNRKPLIFLYRCYPAKGVDRGNRCEGSNPSFSAQSLVNQHSQGFSFFSDSVPLWFVIAVYYSFYYSQRNHKKAQKKGLPMLGSPVGQMPYFLSTASSHASVSKSKPESSRISWMSAISS